MAADMPMATKAPLMAAPVFSWTGCYVGANVGGGVSRTNVQNSEGINGQQGNGTGAIAGGQLGCNYQDGNWVFGLEGEGFWSGIKGNDSVQFNNGAFPGVGAIDADNLRWGGTIRAVGGIAVDRWLLFFTGGYAYGNIQHTNTPPGGPIDQFNVQANGLTAGAGFSYAITNNIIGKFEYRYYNFNGYNRPGNPLTPNGQIPYTTETTYSVVTVGLDFKFGGPVVAKY